MNAPRIGVLGAGAIGSYVGGRLAVAGEAVVFVGRLGAEVREHGLTLTDLTGARVVVRPQAIRYESDVAALSECDVVLVTVKSMATRSAGQELARVLIRPTTIVSLQNGVTNAATLRAVLPGHTIVAGMVPFNVKHDGGGRFHRGTSGALALENEGNRAQTVADALRRSGFDVDLFDDLLPIQHSKLLFNLNNSVNALSGLPLREELSNRDYRRVVALSMREGMACMKAAGIKPARVGRMIPWIAPAILSLPNALFFRAAAPMVKIDPEARSSMLDDLDRRRPTEIDHLNGAIIGLADRTGLQAKVNRVIAGLVKDAEKCEAGSPRISGESLLAAVSARI